MPSEKPNDELKIITFKMPPKEIEIFEQCLHEREIDNRSALIRGLVKDWCNDAHRTTNVTLNDLYHIINDFAYGCIANNDFDNLEKLSNLLQKSADLSLGQANLLKALHAGNDKEQESEK